MMKKKLLNNYKVEMMNHILFKSNNEFSTYRSEYESITLDELNAIIGGWIEIVRKDENAINAMASLPENTIVIVDEEGLLKDLNPNFLASWITNRLIVGDVVISKENGGGEIIGFDDSELENVMSLVTNFKTIMEDGE